MTDEILIYLNTLSNLIYQNRSSFSLAYRARTNGHHDIQESKRIPLLHQQVNKEDFSSLHGCKLLRGGRRWQRRRPTAA
ncbi:hypothetical protein ACXWOZ_09530, partial [Streptococcus pyogenes]